MEKVTKLKTVLFGKVKKLSRLKTKLKKPSFLSHMPRLGKVAKVPDVPKDPDVSIFQDVTKSPDVQDVKKVTVDQEVTDIPKASNNPVKRVIVYLRNHKFRIGGTIVAAAFVIFIAGAIYQGYFQNSGNTSQSSSKGQKAIGKSKEKVALKTTNPSPVSPSPSSDPSPSSVVLGTSDSSDTDTTSDDYTSPSPEISDSPIPTDIPIPTDDPSSTSSNSSSSSNSNCTTASGVPNSWYSDVYPVSPITASGGSATLSVTIRDCNINAVSKSSTLKISLSSGDPNALVNGQNMPVTVTTQNGQASFTVTSQVAGTVALSIQDTTDSFSLTDTNNNTPSIVFNGQSGPTPAPTQEPTAAPTQSVSSTPSTAPTSSPTQTATPTL